MQGTAIFCRGTAILIFYLLLPLTRQCQNRKIVYPKGIDYLKYQSLSNGEYEYIMSFKDGIREIVDLLNLHVS